MVNCHGSDVWRVGSQDTVSVKLHMMSGCKVDPKLGEKHLATAHRPGRCLRPVQGAVLAEQDPSCRAFCRRACSSWRFWELDTSNGPPGQMTDSQTSSNQLHGSRLHLAADPHSTVQSIGAEEVSAGLLQESRHLG